MNEYTETKNNDVVAKDLSAIKKAFEEKAAHPDTTPEKKEHKPSRTAIERAEREEKKATLERKKKQERENARLIQQEKSMRKRRALHAVYDHIITEAKPRNTREFTEAKNKLTANLLDRKITEGELNFGAISQEKGAILSRILVEEKDASKIEHIHNILTRDGVDVVVVHGGYPQSQSFASLSEAERNILERSKEEDIIPFKQDLDTAGAQYLLQSTPIKYSEGAQTTFVAPGEQIDMNDPEFKDKNVLALDVGNSEYGVILKDMPDRSFVFANHHQEKSRPFERSATGLTFDMLKKTGILEAMPAKEEKRMSFIADFIDRVDYLDYDFDIERDKDTWPRTMYALSYNLPHEITFDILSGMSQHENLDPGTPFKPESLEKHIVAIRDKDNVDPRHFEYITDRSKTQDPEGFARMLPENKRAVTLADIAHMRKNTLEKSRTAINSLATQNNEQGINTDNEALGKTLVARYKTPMSVPMRFEAVRGAGFDSYVELHTTQKHDEKTNKKWTQTTGFMISTQIKEKAQLYALYQDLKQKYPGIIMVRGSMIMYKDPDGKGINPHKLLRDLHLLASKDNTPKKTTPEKQTPQETENKREHTESFTQTFKKGDPVTYMGISGTIMEKSVAYLIIATNDSTEKISRALLDSNPDLQNYLTKSK